MLTIVVKDGDLVYLKGELSKSLKTNRIPIYDTKNENKWATIRLIMTRKKNEIPATQIENEPIGIWRYRSVNLYLSISPWIKTTEEMVVRDI